MRWRLIAFRRAFVLDVHKQAEHQRRNQQHERGDHRQTPAVTAALQADQRQNRRDAGADGKECMQQIEGRGVAAGIIAHDAVVVVGDRAFGQTGEQHGGDQPEGSAVQQHHQEADRHERVQQQVGAFEAELDRCGAGNQADREVANRLDGQQRAAGFIIQRISFAQLRQH